MVKVKVEDIQNNETTDDYETNSESDNEEQEVVEAKTKKHFNKKQSLVQTAIRRCFKKHSNIITA